MSLALLLESALRALLLGASLWVLMRLVRLRDARTETMLWTLVLLAALAMPLLSPLVERWWPALPVPRLPAPLAIVPAPDALHLPPRPRDWLVPHAMALLWGFYALISAIFLARLATGLVLTARLYRRARPVTAAWAEGRAIRASTAIRGPLAFGTAILLPADYRDWPDAKLAAVLAHEQCHVRRGDFFIQLLASLHRALFWFSPFAWWLQAQLCALAETASDEAAVRSLNDRACYAEILIEVSLGTRSLPLQGTAMARGPDIEARIERILDDRAAQNLGWGARTALIAATLPVALAMAGAHAATSAAAAPAAAALPRLIGAPQTHPARTVPARAAAREVPAAMTSRHARHARAVATYDPRALLRDPTAVMVRGLLVTTSG